MKYVVTTSYLTLVDAGDPIHEDDWIFDTREEAQEFVDKFHEAFPKDESSERDYSLNAYDPYIYADNWVPEVKEIDNDPYAWLDKMIAGRNKVKNYLQKHKSAV